jgi:hypothetical protein
LGKISMENFVEIPNEMIPHISIIIKHLSLGNNWVIMRKTTN